MVSRLEFTKQPPSNLRKSNFFHFMIQLFDRLGNQIEIERTSFRRFIDEGQVRRRSFNLGDMVPYPLLCSISFKGLLSSIQSNIGMGGAAGRSPIIMAWDSLSVSPLFPHFLPLSNRLERHRSFSLIRLAVRVPAPAFLEKELEKRPKNASQIRS